jgi:hypothetical protein
MVVADFVCPVHGVMETAPMGLIKTLLMFVYYSPHRCSKCNRKMYLAVHGGDYSHIPHLGDW